MSAQEEETIELYVGKVADADAAATTRTTADELFRKEEEVLSFENVKGLKDMLDQQQQGDGSRSSSSFSHALTSLIVQIENQFNATSSSPVTTYLSSSTDLVPSSTWTVLQQSIYRKAITLATSLYRKSMRSVRPGSRQRGLLLFRRMLLRYIQTLSLPGRK